MIKHGPIERHIRIAKMNRKCGECTVCCYIGAIPELKKPPHTVCKYVKKSVCGSCLVHDTIIPKTCSDFKCSWWSGEGQESDRPDKIGVMFSLNRIENQIYLLAIEIWDDAIRTTGKQMAIEVSKSLNVPMIVVYHSSKPPNDGGDALIIQNSLLTRCKSIAGDIICKLDDTTTMHKLLLTKTFDYQVKINGSSISSI